MLFISHSSQDHRLVSAFRNVVLPDAILDSTKYPVRFTSADAADTKARLWTGDNIWKTLREDLDKTKIFVACVSKDYLNSPWCLAELAIFYDLRQNDPSRRLVPLIVDERCNEWRSLPFLQEPKIINAWSERSIKELVAEWRTLAVVKADPFAATNALNYYLTNIRSLMHEKEYAAGGFLAELAQQYYTSGATDNGPWAALVSRNKYEQIAVRMAQDASQKLLWTLFKSPLLVADSYSKPDYLMEYDSLFSEFLPVRKVRLVIFEGPTDAKAYHNLDLPFHSGKLGASLHAPIDPAKLRARKDAFEQSALKYGHLYFTTLDKLNELMRLHLHPQLLPTSYLEFAYAQFTGTSRVAMFMDSSFNSEWRNTYGGHKSVMHSELGHVTFYSPNVTNTVLTKMRDDPYGPIFGHLKQLSAIAEELFAGRPKPELFVTSPLIGSLY